MLAWMKSAEMLRWVAAGVKKYRQLWQIRFHYSNCFLDDALRCVARGPTAVRKESFLCLPLPDSPQHAQIRRKPGGRTDGLISFAPIALIGSQ